MSRLLILICCIISITACSNKNQPPSGILSQVQMQAVLWDMITAQTFTTSFFKKDSSNNSLIENLKFQKEILAIHNISKEEFYKSYEYYKGHPEIFQAILDSISVNAVRERDLQFKNKFKPSSPKPLSPP